MSESGDEVPILLHQDKAEARMYLDFVLFDLHDTVIASNAGPALSVVDARHTVYQRFLSTLLPI